MSPCETRIGTAAHRSPLKLRGRRSRPRPAKGTGTVRISIKTAVLAGTALLGATALFLATRPAPPRPEPPAPPVPVVTVPVRQGDVPIILNGLGTVQALNTATVRTQVTGQLLSVDFTEGQTVHRGDILAQIDPVPYQAALTQAQAQASRDQAQIDSTQINLNRNIPLLHTGYATDQLVTNERYQIAEFQAALKSDEGAIQNAQAQLGYTTLRAPFDGVTGLRLLDVGNIIHPTDANGLVVVTEIQPISVVFTLPAADIGQVQDAMTHGTVTAIAYDQSGAKKLDTGTLLAASNQADPQSGTVQFKAIFPNPQRHLWPGVFVNIELHVAIRKDALSIPTDAIQQGPTGDFTFVVGAGNKVSVQPIRVAQRAHGTALISRGLEPGETVVTQGQYRLTAGTVIVPATPDKVANSSTASAGMLP
jgi:membrane fusion protein, multidrug efflux system